MTQKQSSYVAIPMAPVQSAQIGAVGYDPATKTLAVSFTRGAGAIYQYPGVTQETFDAFMAAESKGTFFGKHIKALPFEKFPSLAEQEKAKAATEQAA